MIYVVSTGLSAPTKEKCMASVRMQRDVDWVHSYVEASTQSPSKSVLENLHDVISPLAPDTVVVWLDGDDYLIRPDALAIVSRMHDAGAWVTWGSFEFSDGRAGFAADLDWSIPVRQQPWVTTHLKSFRAGLFHRLDKTGWWQRPQTPWDMLVMFACIEMAGRERSKFCPEVLCAYNFASSNEFRNGPDEERRIASSIRSQYPYTRVADL